MARVCNHCGGVIGMGWKAAQDHECRPANLTPTADWAEVERLFQLASTAQDFQERHDARVAIVTALRAVRNSALEEAARKCDAEADRQQGFATQTKDHPGLRHPWALFQGCSALCRDRARSIRDLKSTPQEPWK